MTTQQPAGSFFDIRANRRGEREFVAQVEAAFTPDPAAIARVRAAVLAQAPELIKGQPRQATRWSAGTLAWRTVGLAMILVVAVVGGFAVASLRAAPPGGSIAAGTNPSAGASAVTQNGAPADLDESQASLARVLTTAKSGDTSALAAVLVSYQSDLKAIAADLGRPGANLSAARARLVTQASGLSSIAAAVTTTNAALFRQVSSDLAALIASLPVPAAPTQPKPGNGTGNGNGAPTTHPTPTHPTPTSHPGNGNSGGNGKGNGNGNGNAGGNGKGNGHASGHSKG